MGERLRWTHARIRIALLVSILACLMGSVLVVASPAAATTVRVTLDISSPQPHEWVLVQYGHPIHAVDGSYAVTLNEDGKAYVSVAMVNEGGVIGPWYPDPDSWSRGSLTWDYSAIEFFEITATTTSIGPLQATDHDVAIPDQLVHVSANQARNSGSWRPVIDVTWVAVPPGSTVAVDLLGCHGDQSAVTFTTTPDGQVGSFFAGIHRRAIGRSGFYRATVKTPGLPDRTWTRPLRVFMGAACDPTLFIDDAAESNGAGSLLPPDTVDGHNGLPVWVEGGTNALPRSLYSWSRRGKRRPRVNRVIRASATTLGLPAAVHVSHTWQVGRRYIRARVVNGRVTLRIKPAWRGKRVRLHVDAWSPTWASKKRVISYGRVRR